jgi:hypothetical protein
VCGALASGKRVGYRREVCWSWFATCGRRLVESAGRVCGAVVTLDSEIVAKEKRENRVLV